MVDDAATHPLRVLVVDDHDLFRGGLAVMLREEGLEVVGEAASAEEGLRLAGSRRPDVVIMDLSLPSMSGIEATAALHERHPEIAVLVLTASLDEHDVIEALLSGAAGYLLKDAPIERIAEALEAARDGDVTLSPRLTRKLVERLRADGAGRADGAALSLSEREREILAHVVAGRDNAEIAERLYLSPSTVKNHVSAILRKLGVENRVQAAVQAVRLGLI